MNDDNLQKYKKESTLDRLFALQQTPRDPDESGVAAVRKTLTLLGHIRNISPVAQHEAPSAAISQCVEVCRPKKVRIRARSLASVHENVEVNP
jgi:hypothetical protein